MAFRDLVGLPVLPSKGFVWMDGRSVSEVRRNMAYWLPLIRRLPSLQLVHDRVLLDLRRAFPGKRKHGHQ